MDYKDLPFKIGMQYENWEFDLEIAPKDRIKGYDGFIYLGEITVLNIKPLQIELIFGLDILAAVILSFKESDIPKFEMLKEHGYTQINQYFYISSPMLQPHIAFFLLHS
ncbi:hypothetical protein [Galbibacter sp.]|uniref:hypothetical protein n=1 Tax=Galbibacter sp. TaxID=2918471 RepID=UPI003A9299BF